MAAATGPASAIPLPGIGAVVDVGVIIHQIQQYPKYFGLPSEDSPEYEMLDIRFKQRMIKNISIEIGSSIAVEAGAGEIAKYIPVAGTALAYAISTATMTKYLFGCIDEFLEAALQIWDRTVGDGLLAVIMVVQRYKPLMYIDTIKLNLTIIFQVVLFLLTLS